ncbi:histone H1-like [Dunckerocampus dactyliophorus]|uniref:histone H1-like n=1 Tax=Dunckerocampus dactyliophorus TaxID=161453 RepID=UPI002407200E|nr:histone H1-like [Dunckerocampus dactyliophorus]
MAEEAPAPAGPSKTQTKPVKKKATTAASKARRDGLSLPKLITQVVTESKERKGTSVAAIKKALANKNVDVVKSNKRINTALVSLVTSGGLVQTKGVGASGSFKLAKPESGTKTKAAKKPAAKKAPAKKTVAKKTPATKKPAGKSKKVTTPKKARSPAKKTKTAAAKSPKKSKPVKKSKPAAKKSPAKKAPAKKAPAKKPASKKAAPKKSKK